MPFQVCLRSLTNVWFIWVLLGLSKIPCSAFPGWETILLDIWHYMETMRKQRKAWVGYNFLSELLQAFHAWRVVSRDRIQDHDISALLPYYTSQNKVKTTGTVFGQKKAGFSPHSARFATAITAFVSGTLTKDISIVRMWPSSPSVNWFDTDGIAWLGASDMSTTSNFQTLSLSKSRKRNFRCRLRVGVVGSWHLWTSVRPPNARVVYW